MNVPKFPMIWFVFGGFWLIASSLEYETSAVAALNIGMGVLFKTLFDAWIKERSECTKS